MIQLLWLLDIPPEFLKPTKDLCVDLFSSSARPLKEIPSGLQHLQRFEVSENCGLKLRMLVY